MIPTRDEMETMLRCPAWTLGDQHLALSWMKSMRDEIDRLRADLDRANTEAALARDAMAKATTDTRAKVQNELRSVERALCSADVLIKYAEWPRGAYECHVKNTIETAIDALRDDSATTPYSPPFEGDPKDCAFKASDPVREEAIRAWEKEALFDMYEHADDDEKAHQDDAFLVRRREITAAVAMMRSAGDPDAKLRELRAWIIDEKWCAPGIVRKIDEMLARPCPEVPETPKIQPSEDREAKIEAWEMHSAGDGKALRELRAWILEMWWVASQGKWETGAHTAGKVVGRIDEMLARPAPSHVYSRGRTIAESAEPPTAYYPPSPVEQPTQPDDPRWELVAQLADLFKVHLSCNGGVNRLRSDRAAEIAAKLRGGA